MKEVNALKPGRGSSGTLTIGMATFFLMSVLYLTLPVVIFFIGYLKPLWAVLFTVIMSAGGVMAVRGVNKGTDGSLSAADEKKIELKPSHLITVVIMILLVLYWGGVSEFGCCSADHRVRYAILNDLVHYKWPVVYDFSTQQNPAVAERLGDGQAAFAYYFVFWTVPAVIGKLFGLMAARVALFIWSGIGLFLVWVGASLLYRRASRALFVFLIFFAGIDVIPYYINRITDTTTTWEGWNLHLYVHGNFFQIMNVFNQSIPGLVITILLLLCINGRSVGFLGGLMFCYSPWATIGILPMCVCKLIMTSRSAASSSDSMPRKAVLRNIITLPNIAPPMICLVCFGLLYTSNPSATGADGFIWTFYSSPLTLIKEYIWYVIFEFGIWFLLIYRRHKSDPMFRTALATLMILPIYKISIANDFLMRGSLAPLFLIALYSVMFVTDNFDICRSSDVDRRRAVAARLVLAVMILASYTPANQMLYSALTSYQMHFTDEPYEYEQDYIGSFGNIIREDQVTMVETQFYVYDYEDAAFFKYLAK